MPTVALERKVDDDTVERVRGVIVIGSLVDNHIWVRKYDAAWLADATRCNAIAKSPQLSVKYAISALIAKLASYKRRKESTAKAATTQDDL